MSVASSGRMSSVMDRVQIVAGWRCRRLWTSPILSVGPTPATSQPASGASGPRQVRSLIRTLDVALVAIAFIKSEYKLRHMVREGKDSTQGGPARLHDTSEIICMAFSCSGRFMIVLLGAGEV